MKITIQEQKSKIQQIKPFFHNILSMLPQGILVLDEKEGNMYSNTTIKKILQCKKSEILDTLKKFKIKQVDQRYSTYFDDKSQKSFNLKSMQRLGTLKHIQMQNQQRSFLKKFTENFQQIQLKPSKEKGKLQNSQTIQAKKVPAELINGSAINQITIEQIIQQLLQSSSTDNNMMIKSEIQNHQQQLSSHKGSQYGQFNSQQLLNYQQPVDEEIININNQLISQYNHKIQIQDNIVKIRIDIEKNILQLKLISCNLTVNNNGEQKSQSIVIVMLEDISQEVNLKYLQDNNQYKIRLLSSFSHELRTPLNCSISMLERAINCSDIETIQGNLQPALQSNKILLNIVNDILDYAQIEAGTFKLDLSQFSLYNLLEECKEMYSIQAQVKNLSLQLQYDQRIPLQIISDQNRIRQIVLNFLSNSLKYTNQGQITIKAEIVDINRFPIQIKISVQDTGPGVSKEMLQEMKGKCIMQSILEQEKEERLNIKVKKIGFGLQISQNLACSLAPVDTFQQPIQIESCNEMGSTFSFIIVNQLSNNQIEDDNLQIRINQYIQIQNNQQDQIAEPLSNMQSFNQINANLSVNDDNENIRENTFSIKEKKPKINILEIKYLGIKEVEDVQNNYTFQDYQDSEIPSKNQSEMNSKQNKNKEIFTDPITKYVQGTKTVQSKFDHQQNDSSLLPNFNSDHILTNQHRKPTKYSTMTFSENDIELQLIRQIQSKKNCKHFQFLICDDDQFNLISLKLLLENFKCQSDVANSGFEAIQKVQERLSNKQNYESCCSCFYQIIFMDIDMPIKDGYQTTVEINQIYSKYIDNLPDKKELPPIIACTAFDTEEYKIKAIQHGMKDYITKPVKKEILKQILFKWMSQNNNCNDSYMRYTEK